MRRITLLGIIALIPCLLVTLLTPCATAEEGSIVLPSYSWNTPQATVLADGNLQWAPQPFIFAKGASLPPPGSTTPGTGRLPTGPRLAQGCTPISLKAEWSTGENLLPANQELPITQSG